MRRIFVAILLLVGVLGGHVAHACDSDEIDVLGDGTNCQTTKFTLTTTEIADGGTFQFYMSAKGTFYVDCGAGGALSGTGASGMTITRSNTTGATYTCTYTGNTEAKTIRFGGIAATGNAYSTGVNISAAAIRFNVTPALVASISGSLGALFPSRGTTTARQPVFWATFASCTNLTEIPSGLFSGVTGARTYMYSQTFWGCTGLEEIPAELFSGNSGAADYMFWNTFYGCTSLESIPDGLFSGISGTKKDLFYQTFYNCSGLTGYIPAGLFDKITTYSTSMMTNMFYGTGLDTTCSGTTVQYITGFENYWNGKVSCTEPFVTPVTLNDQSATTASVPTTVYLKYRTGWYADVGATTPISALATNPTKTDYDFDGYWTATNGAGTQVIDANGDFISTDATLRLAKITDASKTIYANWTTDYTVTYDCGDGTGTPPANGTATLTKTFTPALNTCLRDGYIFSGWLVSGTSDIKTGGFTWNYAENKTFTAQWTKEKFTLTTTEIASGGTFQFYISAKGTFYVDCGAAGTLSGTGASGMTITRSNTTGATYTCTYTTAGIKAIRFGGIAATGSAYVNGGSTSSVSAIRFNVTPKLVASVTGSLGALFPSRGTAAAQQPSFWQTFAGCENLTEISSDLFSGVTGATSTMFYQAFYHCTSLKSIPSELFSGINGTAGGLFHLTFAGCTSLKEIPRGLFSGISGAPASNIFSQTFSGCSGLTGSIPEDLFSGISGAPATAMFQSTFNGCSGLTGSIPEDLFSGISGAPILDMFSATFAGCSGLTGPIPSGLFGNISGAPAGRMFSSTFAGCSNLSGYVPSDIFENITSSTGISSTFSGTKMYTECPCGTKPAETGWGATVVDGRAVCEVGTKDNEHWNNGICTTDCGLGFSKLKSSTGLEFPIFTDETTPHSINIGIENNVCHVPLENGAANNAINVSWGGNTYHATVPDEIVPDGFTGQPAPVQPD